MLWIDRTGAPWRDLLTRYGRWATVATRFSRWPTAGLGERTLHTLQAQADARGERDWDTHEVDGIVIRAHQNAAGAKGGTQTLANSMNDGQDRLTVSSIASGIGSSDGSPGSSRFGGSQHAMKSGR